MIIQDNVIKHYLRNVYFICGNACGGKTTMSRMLAEKHGFLLYDMDGTPGTGKSPGPSTSRIPATTC